MTTETTSTGSAAPALRIEEIELRNVKNVDHLVLRPNAQGVTVVHGANESGKSTLIEAFSMLLKDIKLNSNKAEVAALAPIGVDEKPFVRAVLSLGDYHLSLEREFGKSSKATLQVDRPRVENLSGTQALDRFQEILEEHSDASLRNAMSIEQGDILNLKELFKNNQLSHALGRAGSQQSGNGVAEVLVDGTAQAIIEAARQEREQYFTSGSWDRWKKSFQEQHDELEEARDQLEEARQRLATVEEFSVQVERSKANIDRFKKDKVSREQRVTELEEDYKRAQSHQEELDRAQQQVVQTEEKVEQLRTELTRRTELQKEITRLTTAVEKATGVADAAKEKFAAEERLSAQRRTAMELDRLEFNLALATRELARQRREQQALSKQRTTSETLLKTVKEQNSVRVDLTKKVEANVATPERAQDVEQALQEWNIHTAQRDAAATSVSIAGPTGSTITDGDIDVTLDKDGYVTKVSSARTFSLGDYTVGISPAGGVEDLDQKVAHQRNQLIAALNRALTDQLDTTATDKAINNAVAALRNHADARAKDVAELASIKRELAAALGETTIPELEEQMEHLAASISRAEAAAEEAASGVREEFAAWEVKQDPNTDNPLELEELLAAETVDEQWVETTRARVNSADAGTDQRLDQLRVDVSTAESQLATATSQLELRQRDHASAEQVQATQELQKATDQAQQEADKATTALTELQKKFSGSESLEMITTKLDGARSHIRQLDSNVRNEEEKILIAQHDISLAGGSANELQEAESRLEHLEAEFESAERQANAANLLYELLTDAHSDIVSRYQAPFLEEFTRLSKNVFGPEVSYELDEDLAVTKRIAAGIDVPLDQLSGGATEQIAMLYRLAAASLMGRGESVPIFLDDTLGYTDAFRAENMNAVLALMGKNHQIIVTTCDVNRFSAIPDADIYDIVSLK